MTYKKSKIHWLLTAMLLVAAMLMPSVASAAIIPFKPIRVHSMETAKSSVDYITKMTVKCT